MTPTTPCDVRGCLSILLGDVPGGGVSLSRSLRYFEPGPSGPQHAFVDHIATICCRCHVRQISALRSWMCPAALCPSYHHRVPADPARRRRAAPVPHHCYRCVNHAQSDGATRAQRGASSYRSSDGETASGGLKDSLWLQISRLGFLSKAGLKNAELLFSFL